MFNFKKKEPSKNYRKTGLETNYSNYGWYTCVHCGKKFRKGDIDIDHIIPKSIGGTNDAKNLQCLCKHCNRSKQADTSRTKQDLKNRKATYKMTKRAVILREQIKNNKQLLREDIAALSNEDLKNFLNDAEVMAKAGVFLQREAIKRGL